MKILTEYRKTGYEFTLFKREGDCAIFRGVKEGSPAVNWEVIHIQHHDGRHMRFTDKETGEVTESYAEPAEYPPCDAQWGTHGFTAFNEQDALVMLESLTRPS